MLLPKFVVGNTDDVLASAVTTTWAEANPPRLATKSTISNLTASALNLIALLHDSTVSTADSSTASLGDQEPIQWIIGSRVSG
jgi:hypothetical protein